MGFLLFPVGEKGFRFLCVSLRVCFGLVKLMNFLQKCPFAYLKNLTLLNFDQVAKLGGELLKYLLQPKRHPKRNMRPSVDSKV